MVKLFREKLPNPKLSLDPVFIVNSAAKLHIKLTESATLINRAFGFQILLLIAICFVGSVSALFCMIMNMTRDSLNEHQGQMILMAIIWLLTNAVELLPVVLFTSNLCEEVTFNNVNAILRFQLNYSYIFSQ